MESGIVDANAQDNLTMEDCVRKGMSKVEIASTFSVSLSTVKSRVAKVMDIRVALDGYKKVEVDDLQLMKISALENITSNKLQEASVRDLIGMYKILDDRKRLTEGNPTEINGMLIAHIRAVDDEKKTKLEVKPTEDIIDASFEDLDDDEVFEEEALFEDEF